MKSLNDKKDLFKVELLLAIIIAGLSSAACFSNILLASNDLYPMATDFMGHMAKVDYIAYSLKGGIMPSWYPYWYAGTAVTQYYPPLSYYILASIYIITGNVMLTFKLFNFLVLFSGGVGVWYFCRCNVGSWCGLLAIVIFCLQPYIRGTLLDQGQVAQGPIIAILPWYLLVVLNMGVKPSAMNFAQNIFFCFLMILSHPNSIFMYCICIMFSLLPPLVFKQVNLANYIFIGLSIFFAGLLSAFWSLAGVTRLENPSIPHVLGEAVSISSATLEWFLNPYNFLYFSLSCLVGSAFAAAIYVYRRIKKNTGREENYVLSFNVLLLVFSMVFSFGYRFPLFKYLPMAESMVAGRVLCLSSFPAAILCAYGVYRIIGFPWGKKCFQRGIAYMLCFVLVASIMIDVNPFKIKHSFYEAEDFAEFLSIDNDDRKRFDRGRLTFIGPFPSAAAYFPIEYGFAMGEGYNIEGTIHNRYIWNENIAIASDSYDYIASKLAFFNIRYLILSNTYRQILGDFRSDYNFQTIRDLGGSKFYISKKPSTYFIKDNRNALIFGSGSAGIAMKFPFLIHDDRENIDDYSLEELSRYALIYICEPAVDTMMEKEEIESIITQLVRKDVKIIIEPSYMARMGLFDVTSHMFSIESSPKISKTANSTFVSELKEIAISADVQSVGILFGLDTPFYELIQNQGRVRNDIIGTKKVGQGEVLFMGMQLSHYLKPVYAMNWGEEKLASLDSDFEKQIEAIYECIFDFNDVNKGYWPEAFTVKNANWHNKGVDFEYESETDASGTMTVSLTYSPRWKAAVDGESIEVGQRENLITLDLPEGKHRVSLIYGVTKYGVIGYIVSAIALILLLLFIRYYGIILRYTGEIIEKCCKMLQI